MYPTISDDPAPFTQWGTRPALFITGVTTTPVLGIGVVQALCRHKVGVR